MQRKNAFEYMRLGALMQFLIQCETKLAVHGTYGVVHGIDDLVSSIEAASLPVSIRAAQKLRGERQSLGVLPQDARLSQADRDRLSDIVLSLRDTVQAEVQGIELLTPTPKRIDVWRLQQAPEQLFAPGIFESLPDLTRLDLSEAALCISYERSTAAAFHLLRATENTLREMYCALVRRNRTKSLNWGPIQQDLTNHPSVIKKISDASALLAQLDYIRRQFRNPTQHPDKVYDIEEVQDLFSLCTDVITRMRRATP
jgi:hypothetical protein